MLFAGITLYEFRVGNQFSVLVAGFINVISVFAFSMVVEYGRQIVVWRHFIKFISSGNAISEMSLRKASANAPSNTSLNHEMNTSRPRAFYLATRNWMHKAHIHDLLKLWDFPYVFLIMSLAIIMELMFSSRAGGALSVSPLGFYLYFYAISYPIIIVCILIKNVMLKVIENDYQKLTVHYMDMLDRNFKAK